MEQPTIAAISHDTSEAKLTVQHVPDRPGVAAQLFRSLADEGVNVDMIVQNTSVHGTTDISFTIPMSELQTGVKVTEAVAGEIEATEVSYDTEIGRVSLVGAGMRTNPGIAATVFEVLAAEGINVEMISTSTILISCVVRAAQVERAVRALHDAFELSK